MNLIIEFLLERFGFALLLIKNYIVFLITVETFAILRNNVYIYIYIYIYIDG